MPNDPINFRLNDEDRKILDKIKTHLAKLTMQPVFDTAAIRYALRSWNESNDKSKQKE